MEDVKDYIKSFGRIPTAPPGKVINPKKTFKRLRPGDRKRLLEEALIELEDDFYEEDNSM